MKNIKHIFFDLDHTLWDFDKNSSETLSEIYDDFELDKTIGNKERFIATYRTVNGQFWKKYRDGHIDKQTVRFGRFSETLSRFKVANASELGLQIGNEYVKRGPHKTHLFENTHETLGYLYGKYTMHIITNGFKEVQAVKLAGADLSKYFKVVLCSEDVGVNKPNKKVFEKALDLAGANSKNSIMIGDNLEADIIGAQKVGIGTFLFDPNKEKRTTITPIIHNLKDLQNIL